ncbi:hypothetical protein NITMOv2_3661 [Nitrospira moscoviensis]|uniref:Uncharacterized protein n=1 Tax=Nitrospira moscoviensis TaxID=42253 RepID=A0A0K2GGG5_NITMO|nr:hypothetical protein NITMOv2_3661 [Nitrospira moscoviensis]
MAGLSHKRGKRANGIPALAPRPKASESRLGAQCRSVGRRGEPGVDRAGRLEYLSHSLQGRDVRASVPDHP